MAEQTTIPDYQEEDRLHEAIASFEQALDAGAVPDPRQWLDRYPEVAGRLAEFFADQHELRRRLGDGLPWARPRCRLPGVDKPRGLVSTRAGSSGHSTALAPGEQPCPLA